MVGLTGSITTDIYGHHLQSVEQQIANEFDDIFKGGTKDGTNDKKLRVVK
ncbi:MAG: hypothetical protein GX214_06275 [Clostridiales bacterium]|nr:hypothetical protein [Clostridiales bacterium]